MGAGQSVTGDRLLDQVFNLKMTSKQLAKMSVRAEKEEKAEKLKVRGWEGGSMGEAKEKKGDAAHAPASEPGARLACTLAVSETRGEAGVLAPGGDESEERWTAGTLTPFSHPPSPTPQVKKAIEKGNIEGAKIYAQNAIRKKGEALNYLKLASRLDATVARLDTQAKMQGVTRSMAGIVKTLDKALAANNLDKVREREKEGERFGFVSCLHDHPPPTAPPPPQVAETMDQFEKQFENLDVQSSVLEGAMASQAALATPEEDVTTLLQQVADEHGLEVELNLPQAGAVPVAAPAAEEKDDLSARLAQLRGGGQ